MIFLQMIVYLLNSPYVFFFFFQWIHVFCGIHFQRVNSKQTMIFIAVLLPWWESFRSAFFDSTVILKVPITLSSLLSNCFNWRLLFINPVLPILSRSFSVLKWYYFRWYHFSVDFHVKNMPLALFFSSFGGCIYCIYSGIFCWRVCTVNPF